MDAIIIDADGTIVDVSAIRYLLPNFHAFHMESTTQPIIETTRAIWHIAQAVGIKVILVTARKRRYREQTWWHLALEGLFPDDMFMRADKDDRQDAEVKEDILTEIRRRGYNVVGAVDDNPNVVEVWRRHGIPTIVIPGFTEPRSKHDSN